MEQRGAHEGGGRAWGGRRTPYLVASWMLLLRRVQVSWIMFVPKSRSRRFHSVWTPFDILFLRNSGIGKKQQFWAGPPVNRLVPKII